MLCGLCVRYCGHNEYYISTASTEYAEFEAAKRARADETSCLVLCYTDKLLRIFNMPSIVGDYKIQF